MLITALSLICILIAIFATTAIAAYVVSAPNSSFSAVSVYTAFLIILQIAVELTGMMPTHHFVPKMVSLSGSGIFFTVLGLLILKYWATMRIFDISGLRALFFIILHTAFVFAILYGVEHLFGLQRIPSDYQGIYAYDVPANSGFLHERFPSKPMAVGTLLNANAGEVLEIDPYATTLRQGTHADTETVRIVGKGNCFLILESFDERLKRNSQYRIALDNDGIWVDFEDPISNFRVRFRRVQGGTGGATASRPSSFFSSSQPVMNQSAKPDPLLPAPGLGDPKLR